MQPPRAGDFHLLDREIELDLTNVRKRLPGSGKQPAPIRIAAKQGALDERRVGDRARNRLRRAWATVHLETRHPRCTLAVRHDLDRELPQKGVERIGEYLLVVQAASLRCPKRRSPS